MLMETAHGAIERKMLSSLAQSLRASRAKTCATERSGSQVQIMVWFLLTLVANRHQIKTHSDLKDGVIPSRCFELKTCLLIFVISLIYCMILPTCVMLPSQPHAHTHTHTWAWLTKVLTRRNQTQRERPGPGPPPAGTRKPHL